MWEAGSGGCGAAGGDAADLGVEGLDVEEDAEVG